MNYFLYARKLTDVEDKRVRSIALLLNEIVKTDDLSSKKPPSKKSSAPTSRYKRAKRAAWRKFLILATSYLVIQVVIRA